MNELTQGPPAPQGANSGSQSASTTPTVSVNPATTPIGLPGIVGPQNSGASKKKLWIGAGAGALVLLLVFFTQSSLFKGELVSIPDKCSFVFNGEDVAERQNLLSQTCTDFNAINSKNNEIEGLAAEHDNEIEGLAAEHDNEEVQNSKTEASSILADAVNEIGRVTNGHQMQAMRVLRANTAARLRRINEILAEARSIAGVSIPTACIDNITPSRSGEIARNSEREAIAKKEAIDAVEQAHPEADGIAGKTAEANAQIAVISNAIVITDNSTGDPEAKCSAAKTALDASAAVRTLLHQVQAKQAELFPDPDDTDAAIPTDLFIEMRVIRAAAMDMISAASTQLASITETMIHDAAALELNAANEALNLIQTDFTDADIITDRDELIRRWENTKNNKRTIETHLAAFNVIVAAASTSTDADTGEPDGDSSASEVDSGLSVPAVNLDDLLANLENARTEAKENLETTKALREVIGDESSDTRTRANGAVSSIEGAVENLVTTVGKVQEAKNAGTAVNADEAAAYEKTAEDSAIAASVGRKEALAAAQTWVGGVIKKSEEKIAGMDNETGIAVAQFETGQDQFGDENGTIRLAYSDVLDFAAAVSGATEPTALKNLLQETAAAEEQAVAAYATFKTKLAALGCNDMKLEPARSWSHAEAENALKESENYKGQLDTLAVANSDFEEKTKQASDRLVEIEKKVTAAKESAEKSDACTAAAKAKEIAAEVKTLYEKAKAKADEIAAREQRSQNLEAQLTSLQQQLQTQISNNAAASQVAALERELQTLRRQAEEERRLAAAASTAATTATATASAGSGSGSGGGSGAGSGSSSGSSGTSSGASSGSSASGASSGASSGSSSGSSTSSSVSQAPAQSTEVVVVLPSPVVKEKAEDKTQSKTKQKTKNQSKTAAAGTDGSAEAESAKAEKVKQKAAEIGAAANNAQEAAAQKTTPAPGASASKTAGKQTGAGNVAAGQSQGSAQSSGGSAGAVASAKKAAATESGAASTAAGTTGGQKSLRGSYIQGQTGPGVLFYPVLIGAGNGLYWLLRRRKSR